MFLLSAVHFGHEPFRGRRPVPDVDAKSRPGAGNQFACGGAVCNAGRAAPFQRGMSGWPANAHINAELSHRLQWIRKTSRGCRRKPAAQPKAPQRCRIRFHVSPPFVGYKRQFSVILPQWGRWFRLSGREILPSATLRRCWPSDDLHTHRLRISAALFGNPAHGQAILGAGILTP